MSKPDRDDFTGTGTSGPTTAKKCFIATAAYGSELASPVLFLREFRDNTVLKSRFKTGFEYILNIYYKFSPSIANQMRKHPTLKFVMKYLVVWPFVATVTSFVFFIKPRNKKN